MTALISTSSGVEEIAARAKPIAKRIWRLTLVVVLVTILIVEGFVLGPYLARAGSALSRPDLRWLSFAIVAELISMAAFARMQRRMLSTGGTRVSVRQMVALTYAANAVSVSLPGGAALSSVYVFRRLQRWGATVPAAGFTVIASGVLSTFSFALLAIVCAVLAGSGGLSSLLVVAAVLILAAAVLVTRRHRSDIVLMLVSRGLGRANRILHRPADSGLAALKQFARELTEIKPRNRDWLAGLTFAGLNWVADLVCLLASCRAVGAHASTLVLVMVAYIAGMSASGIALLPGGLGVVDAAMIFALTSGGVSIVSSTAAVVLYRLVSYALIVALGWIVWATIWFADRRADSPTIATGGAPIGSMAQTPNA
jgi:putative heme transporter